MTIRLFSWVILVMSAIVLAATMVSAEPVADAGQDLPGGHGILLPSR